MNNNNSQNCFDIIGNNISTFSTMYNSSGPFGPKSTDFSNEEKM